jgi:hypothetical protein
MTSRIKSQHPKIIFEQFNLRIPSRQVAGQRMRQSDPWPLRAIDGVVQIDAIDVNKCHAI